MMIELSGLTPPAVRRRGARDERRDERMEYRLLLAATFAVALPVAALGRLLPRRGPPRGSVLAEAREVANTIVPMAFMA